MGKFEEKMNGIYVLENVKIGAVTIPKKYFQEVKEDSINVQNEPKPNGFYLDIPDR